MFQTDYEFPFLVNGQHVQTFNSVFGLLGALPAGYVSSLIGCQTSMMLSEEFVFQGLGHYRATHVAVRSPRGPRRGAGCHVCHHTGIRWRDSWANEMYVHVLEIPITFIRAWFSGQSITVYRMSRENNNVDY